MKTIKSLLLVAAIIFSSVSFANNDPSKKNETNLRKAISTELSAMLKDPSIQLEKTVETTVKLMLNDENEIVVISVGCDDEKVNSYVKSRLNYKKLKNVESKNRVYILPLKINAS